ncbi:unnamed protein product [Rhizophagus irregularis]|nr:unnamed protein product [Rhizophagus irregularis]
MLVGITTKTVRNVNGSSVLEFYVEENLGDREPREFWVEVNHDPNIRYLSNKTNSINQNMRSTTAIIVGLIQYEPPVIDDTTQEEITAGKHVVKLENISLVSTNCNNTNGQSLNLPWMNAQSTGERSRTWTNRTPRGATLRTSRRGRTTLAQMSQPRNQNLPSALEANPIPNMSTSPVNNEGSSQDPQDQEVQ